MQRDTINEIAAHHPLIKSVAVVPLGLTRYNTDTRLTAVTPEFCRQAIKDLAPVQRKLRERLGTTFAFLGDEIYLRADQSVPSRKHYGDYPQIEDGIGMVRAFRHDFDALMRRLERKTPEHLDQLDGTVMTGTLFAPILKERLDAMNARFGTRLRVVPLENNYFGGDVSVAGLLTGSDLLAARAEVQGRFVIIPGAMIKSGGEALMLDGVTLDEVQEQFGVPVHALDFKAFTRFLCA